MRADLRDLLEQIYQRGETNVAVIDLALDEATAATFFRALNYGYIVQVGGSSQETARVSLGLAGYRALGVSKRLGLGSLLVDIWRRAFPR